MAFLTHSQKPNSKQRTACSELTVVFAVKLTNPKPHFCFFSSLCGKLNSEPAALWQSFQLYHFFLLIVVSLRSHLFLVSAAIRNLTTVANLARSCFMVIAPKLPCHLQILLIGFLNVYFLDVVWTHYITLRHSPGKLRCIVASSEQTRRASGSRSRTLVWHVDFWLLLVFGVWSPRLKHSWI